MNSIQCQTWNIRFFCRYRILDRYILQQFIQAFFIGVFGGIALLLGQQLLLFTDLLIQKGVSGSTVLQLLVLSLPAIAVLTFPIAGLFATLIVIARMGADFELAALRAAGVSYLRIFQPFILLGLVISALSFSVNDFVAPYTNHKVRLLNQSLLLSQDAIPLEPEQFLSIGDRRWLYVNSVESDTLEMAEILLFDFDADSSEGHYPKLISADTARWQDGVLDLNLANVWQFNGDGSSHYTGSVGELRFTIGRALVEYLLGEKSPQELSSRDLGEQIRQLSTEGLSQEQLSQLQSEWHLKFAIPLSSLFAILIAAPLGIQTVRKTGRYGGVVVALSIIFLYYGLLSLARSWGQIGILQPWLSAWLPNLFFGVAAVVLLYPYIHESILLKNAHNER